jgi:hypothetical protein
MSQKIISAPAAPAPHAAPAKTAPRPYAPPRPTIVDYIILLFGFALSFYLIQVRPLPVQPADWVQDERARSFAAFLPDLMRLPQGVILMWPLFLIVQRLRWRKKNLTSIEWLWVLSWLGLALLAVLAVWDAPRGVPPYLQLPDSVMPYVGAAVWWWYLLFVPVMAALGVLFWFFGLFARDPAPWTHSFGLALLLWPLLPLAAMWSLCKLGP